MTAKLFVQRRSSLSMPLSAQHRDMEDRDLRVSDLDNISVKDAIKACCGGVHIAEKDLLATCEVVKASPTICKFVIANPKAFFQNEDMARFHGLDITSFNSTTPLSHLAKHLPVIYIADVHPEYGTLGFLLNRPSGKTLSDPEFHRELKALHDRPVYLGGVLNRGSAFTMVHKKSGFPENRKWKSLPGDNDFKLYFSPDIAMANELCLTKDAHPMEFKFFQWATVWSPNQLELEYKSKMWVTIFSTSDLLFDDDRADCPIWSRVVLSLVSKGAI